MIEVQIAETARRFLSDETHVFNFLKKEFFDLDEVREFLINRYGHLPQGRHKIFWGNEETGFAYSFWNRDISHNSKPWFQTDHIVLSRLTREPVILKRKKRKDH